MIVLVGFMGAGKSTVGALLAEELSLPFVDTDMVVQKRAGATIPGIFASGGEEAFRSLEREVVAEVLAGPRSVVALGGGAVSDPETRANLMDALVLYLDTSYASVIERIGDAADRPMLQLGDPFELFRVRHTMYRSAADIVIETDGKDPNHVAREAAAMVELLESTHLTRVWTSVGDEGYPVYVGADLMARADFFLPSFDGAELAYVITHPSLAELAVPVAAGARGPWPRRARRCDPGGGELEIHSSRRGPVRRARKGGGAPARRRSRRRRGSRDGPGRVRGIDLPPGHASRARSDVPAGPG